MSYRHFRTHDDQAAAEEAAPDRFEPADDWLSLARRARNMGHTRTFSATEWTQLTGMPATPTDTPITAGAAWALLPDYTAARLRGKWVNLEGLAAINEERQNLYREAPTLKNPNDIRGSRLAIYILNQAETDPDRRAGWVKLAQDNDLLGVAMYRPAKPLPERTLRDRISALRPGTCIAITEAERLDVARNPIPGYFVERYTYPRPGGYHICRGTPSSVGFRSAF